MLFQEGESCSAYAFNPLPDRSLCQNKNLPNVSSWGRDHSRTWSKNRTTTPPFVSLWCFLSALEQLKTTYCIRPLFLSFVYSLWAVKFNHTGIQYPIVFDVNSPDSVPYTSSRCGVQPRGRKYPQSRDLWRAEWGGREQWTHLFCPHQHWRTIRDALCWWNSMQSPKTE